ncbi:MAG: hypothetical protein HDR15_05490 [Lachnospiraceae bacterium]|nr:hypothetical protein [Lachnospiraceae bacterium]
MMMKRIICAAIVGIGLLAGFFATGTYGLSAANVEVYTMAVGLEKKDGNFGFENFFLTDYPVAFYDGDKDYRITSKNGEYSVTKRSPVINSIVATAYEVNGEFEVLSPTIEKMSSFISLMNTGMSEYTAEHHAVVIWHEAFHCYQMSGFSGFIDNICSEIDEQIIVVQVDGNSRAVELLKMQMQLLEESVKTNDIDIIRENMVKYKQADEERRELLSESVTALENYYTIVEGTACYVESCAYKELMPESYDEEYISAISCYYSGSSKYYYIGMAQCMILEKLAPGRLGGYTFSKPIIELIYEELCI